MTQRRHASLAIHDSGVHGVRRVRTWHKLRNGGIAVLAVLLLGGGIALWRNHVNAQALAAAIKDKGLRHATVVHAEGGTDGQPLTLPGTLLGQAETPISARIGGYLTRWSKDIGSAVQKGELLAEISSPDAQQQLAQAVAGRQQVVSTVSLAKTTLDRWKGLLEQRAVSQQEFDERRSAYEQAVANLNAVDANIQRLKDMLAFTRVVAPFDGVITKRNVNVGDLIDPGAGRPLFVLTQASSLRAYVYVPQTYSKGVQIGQSVTLTQAELPGQTFKGRVVRTAKAIDPATRSLQVEVGVENPAGQLLPGAYVQVSMPLTQSGGLVIPVNTLLLRGEGPRVAVVDEKGIVSLKAVELGKDFGAKTEVLSGITVADRLVLNPPDGLADGDRLQVVEKKSRPEGKQEGK